MKDIKVEVKEQYDELLRAIEKKRGPLGMW
jgi:hypothetical protein